MVQNGPKVKFFWSVHGTFLIFCMRLWQHKQVNLTHIVFLRNSFFLKVFGPIGAQIGSKRRFFKFCEKSVHVTFLIFGLKLQQYLCLKLIYFWDNLVPRFLDKKVAQNEFFYEKLVHWIFLIFCIKLQQHKGWKLSKTYFDKIFGIFGTKILQMDPKLGVWHVFIFLDEATT